MRIVDALIVMVAFVVVLALLFGLSYFRFQECRRVHPLWYCVIK